MATAETKLSMKLLIDTKANKVLFAEVGKDCVDFLFHILSLPVGSVTKLLKEKGMVGCLSNLYQSVENLNDSYLKSMDIILKPEWPAGISSVPLQLYSYFQPRRVRAIYKCSSSNNCSNYVSFITDDPSALCPSCMTPMSKQLAYKAPLILVATEGGFVKEMPVKYMVMDDLVVKPVSAVSSITSLKDYFNVTDVGVLHEEVVQFGKEEALKLLKLSLDSKSVLTGLFMTRVKVEK